MLTTFRFARPVPRRSARRLPFAEPQSLTLRLLGSGLDEAVHAQTYWQLCAGLKFYERLENFGIHSLGWLVGADVLAA